MFGGDRLRSSPVRLGEHGNLVNLGKLRALLAVELLQIAVQSLKPSVSAYHKRGGASYLDKHGVPMDHGAQLFVGVPSFRREGDVGPDLHGSRCQPREELRGAVCRIDVKDAKRRLRRSAKRVRGGNAARGRVERRVVRQLLGGELDDVLFGDAAAEALPPRRGRRPRLERVGAFDDLLDHELNLGWLQRLALEAHAKDDGAHRVVPAAERAAVFERKRQVVHVLELLEAGVGARHWRAPHAVDEDRPPVDVGSGAVGAAHELDADRVGLIVALRSLFVDFVVALAHARCVLHRRHELPQRARVRLAEPEGVAVLRVGDPLAQRRIVEARAVERRRHAAPPSLTRARRTARPAMCTALDILRCSARYQGRRS